MSQVTKNAGNFEASSASSMRRCGSPLIDELTTPSDFAHSAVPVRFRFPDTTVGQQASNSEIIEDSGDDVTLPPSEKGSVIRENRLLQNQASNKDKIPPRNVGNMNYIRKKPVLHNGECDDNDDDDCYPSSHGPTPSLGHNMRARAATPTNSRSSSSLGGNRQAALEHQQKKLLNDLLSKRRQPQDKRSSPPKSSHHNNSDAPHSNQRRHAGHRVDKDGQPDDYPDGTPYHGDGQNPRHHQQWRHSSADHHGNCDAGKTRREHDTGNDHVDGRRARMYDSCDGGHEQHSTASAGISKYDYARGGRDDCHYSTAGDHIHRLGACRDPLIPNESNDETADDKHREAVAGRHEGERQTHGGRHCWQDRVETPDALTSDEEREMTDERFAAADKKHDGRHVDPHSRDRRYGGHRWEKDKEHSGVYRRHDRGDEGRHGARVAETTRDSENDDRSDRESSSRDKTRQHRPLDHEERDLMERMLELLNRKTPGTFTSDEESERTDERFAEERRDKRYGGGNKREGDKLHRGASRRHDRGDEGRRGARVAETTHSSEHKDRSGRESSSRDKARPHKPADHEEKDLMERILELIDHMTFHVRE